MSGPSLVLVPRSVRFASSRSLFLCVNRATVFELIILVPRARDPSGLHEGSRGAFHLVENSENAGLGVNGKRFFVHPTGKFPEKVELLKR